MDSLSFTVNFADPVLPPSSFGSGLFGFIDMDTDQNPATGINSNANVVFTPHIPMGVDYSIDVFSESVHPGFVDVISRRESRMTIVGRVPITFTDTSLSVTVPLALVGSDNGSVNYIAYFGVVSTTTDRVPNGPEPITSVPGADVIALDNCSELIFSRSGVPDNNLFPVGETIITYKATDASGNMTVATQTVTVVDDTAPIISRVTANPSTIWPPNHKPGRVMIEVADPDGDAVSVDPAAVSVRADRERTSAIPFTADDGAGGTCQGSVTVTVAHRRARP